jgi:hypothetical protein
VQGVGSMVEQPTSIEEVMVSNPLPNTFTISKQRKRNGASGFPKSVIGICSNIVPFLYDWQDFFTF